MAYKIYIREAESDIDVMWHDVTDRILVGNLKLRQGFSSLGSGADLGKITLTYKAYDLATAALFSTSTKCIRIIEGDYILFEGYADSSSSVDSTESTDLAWVKISAYPYLKAMEDVKATEGHVWYDKTAKELMEALWALAVSEAPAWLQDVIKTSCDIIFPEISQVIPFAKISAEDSYLDTIMDIAGEYCYSVRTEGSGMITFLKAYSQVDVLPMGIPYNAVFAKPTIKASPYIFKKAPEVTLSRIVEKNNIDVYSLSDDGSSAEQLIENGKYYPEEGDAEVSYSAPSIETDMLTLEWADGLSLSYQSRREDDTAEGDIEELNVNLSGDSATFRLHNYNTSVSCYLNQLWIKAKRAFFRDSSIIVKADVEGEKSEVETAWIQTEAQAREYAKAIADEARCSTSSLSFKSDVFKLTDIRPGALIKVGDISSTYIIKTIERNLEDDSIQYQCQIYSLADFDTRLLYRSSSSIRGPKGNDAPSLYYIWSSSETEFKPRSRGFWRLGGKWMLYGGRAVGDFLAQDWEKNWTEVMNERSETYRYLWAKVGEDGEPFLFQGVSAADFSVIVSPSSYTINPRSLSPYKVNLKISRLNNLKGISDLILNNTYQGITLAKLGEDEWEVTIEQRMNTPLRFSFTASVNDASKGYTVTGTRIMAENACIGYFTDSPPQETEQRFLDGDTCLVNGIPYKFSGSSWQEIATIEEFESLPYDLAVSTGDCMLGSGDVTESMAVMWAYFGHIFSRSATIDRIRTSRITMEGNGIIKSKNVADSEIGSKYLTSKGYALSGDNGLIQTNGGWFSDAHVQGSLEMGSSSGIHFQALEDDGSGKSKFVIANADKDLLWIGEDGRLHAVMENVMAQTVSGENVNGNETYTDIDGIKGSCYYSTSDFFVLSHNTNLRKITASVMYDGSRGLTHANYGVELLTYDSPNDSNPKNIYRSPWMANMTFVDSRKMAVLEIDLGYPVLLFKIRLRYGERAYPYANLSAYYDITNI